MAITDPNDTLAYHLSRPLTGKVKLDGMMVGKMAKLMNDWLINKGSAYPRPESEALWFYGMNHGISLIRSEYALYEPMRPEHRAFVEAYYDKMSEKALRAAAYLLMICTREARHHKMQPTHKSALTDKFGPGITAFFIANGGEGAIQAKLISHPPNVTVAKYLEALVWIYDETPWPSSYGGPAWGHVTKCLQAYMSGAYTAEMMLDTVWTLCHNNGPIFNKGIAYQCHSHDLVQILDVQRSGQIPELVLEGKYFTQFQDVEMQSTMVRLRDMFPDALGGYVDWFKVEGLGAVNTYPHQKNQQVKSYGISTYASEKEKKAAEEAAYKKALAEKVAKHYATTTYEMLPGVSIPKVVVDRDAA